MNRNQKSKSFRKLVSLLVALVLFASLNLTIPVSATPTTAESVNRVKESIMVVQLAYESANEGKIVVSRGTGFLINDQHLLTCNHIFEVSTDTENYLKQKDGASFNKNKFIREAVVSGDITIKMNVRKESVDSDYSILQLTEAINETIKKPAKLGNSDEGADKSYTTQAVYALGFPESVAEVQNNNTYTSADVTVTDGRISKITSVSLLDASYHEAQTQVIQHSAKLSSGNSGGPLVNEDGAVLGVNAAVIDSYNYSISINQIKIILDTLNIKYATTSSSTSTTSPPPGDTTTEPTTPVDTVNKTDLTAIINQAKDKAADTEKYDSESIKMLESAIEDADRVLSDTAASQTDVDKAIADLDKAVAGIKEKTGMDPMILIAIAVVAVIILIVIIIVAVTAKGRKKVPVPARTPSGAGSGNSPFAPPSPPVSPFANVAPPIPPNQSTYPLNDGAGETSLLNDGAGETSVLGGGAAGALVKMKNGQRIAINRSEFTLGKERRKVDYVIENSSVSRAHAKIRTRAGVSYIIDMDSTNGTYLNGSKLVPNEETKLSNGDKVKISDEEFEFQG